MPMRADAGRGQIQRGGRAEAAGADAQHAARLQLQLPFDADLRHDEMPAVALHFVVRQRRCLERPVGAPPATDGMMLMVSPALHRRLFLLR